MIRWVIGATIAMVLGTSRRTAQCEVELPLKSRVEGALELHREELQPWWQLMSWTLIIIIAEIVESGRSSPGLGGS